MKIVFLPQSFLGKWSVRAIVILCTLFIIRKTIYILSSEPIGESFFDPPIIGILMLGVWIGGLTGFLTGIISLKKEFSIMVILCALIGILIFVFGLAQFLLPI